MARNRDIVQPNSQALTLWDGDLQIHVAPAIARRTTYISLEDTNSFLMVAAIFTRKQTVALRDTLDNILIARAHAND